jgi:hypothetical protein
MSANWQKLKKNETAFKKLIHEAFQKDKEAQSVLKAVWAVVFETDDEEISGKKLWFGMENGYFNSHK